MTSIHPKTSILTGEMAKLHNISKETLRYYHQIGLLIPDTVDEKGYRHYSIEQFAHLDSILFLRELGLSIQEIKDYFEHRNLDSIIHLLKDKSITIKEQLRHLEKTHAAISQKIQLLESYRYYSYGICTLKMYGTRHIARLPLKSYKGIEDFEYGLKELNNSFTNHNLSLFKGMIGVSLSPPHIDLNHFNKWDNIILVFDDMEHENLDILEAGNYATITYIGSYDKGYEYYQKLLHWLHEHRFTIDGDCLFLTITDSAFSNDSNEYINEIQIKIK